ncbi:hypothetical protein LguiB_036003 [Lonicera macranthoides]
MKVRSLVEAPSKPTFGSLLPFPRRSVWRQNRSSCLSFSLHAESARLLAGPNKRVTKVYSSSKASLFQRRPEPIQSMRPRPTGRKILRRAREEEAGYVVSLLPSALVSKLEKSSSIEAFPSNPNCIESTPSASGPVEVNSIPLNINPLVPISVDQEPTGKAIQPGGGTNPPTNLILCLASGPEGAVESLDRIRGRDELSRLGSKSTELADSGGREKHSNRDFPRAGDILERFSSGTSTREARGKADKYQTLYGPFRLSLRLVFRRNGTQKNFKDRIVEFEGDLWIKKVTIQDDRWINATKARAYFLLYCRDPWSDNTEMQGAGTQPSLQCTGHTSHLFLSAASPSRTNRREASHSRSLALLSHQCS